MRVISTDELKSILENHKHWLEEDCDGWENMRADLYDADLMGADLRGADLRGADLIGVDLYDADLKNANLMDADLRGANLIDSNLIGAKLAGAELTRANLMGAVIEKDIKEEVFPLVCPEEGSFIAWKSTGTYIVKLRITEDAKRSSACGRKCRCSKAEVLGIEKRDGSSADVLSVSSVHDPNFIYEVGKTVSVDDFDEDRWNECSAGIHFFITRQEAVDYCTL